MQGFIAESIIAKVMNHCTNKMKRNHVCQGEESLHVWFLFWLITAKPAG